MIEVRLGDLTKVPDVDYIVNAANGVGPMGSGIAGAIRKAGGKVIQDEAFVQCRKLDPQPTEIYMTNAGSLPYNKIVHLVTMKNPGGETSYNIVRDCLKSLVRFCELSPHMKKVGLPALGTGVGALDKGEVARIFKEELEKSEVLFVVVDIDEEFINKF